MTATWCGQRIVEVGEYRVTETTNGEMRRYVSVLLANGDVETVNVGSVEVTA